MMIPIRCFSCGRVIAHKWDKYIDRVRAGENPRNVLESLGFKRYCCKRMFISAVNIMDELLEFHQKYTAAGAGQR